MKEYIRKFNGSTLGSVETASNGDKTVRDFCGKILGYYKKSQDVTTTFTGKIVARGDAAVAFLFCDLERI